MIITIVCDVLGDANNGTSIAAYNLIDYMKSKGHEVRVICSDKDKAKKKGYYVVPTINFHMFNGYVEKNGVQVSKKDDVIMMRAIRGSDIVHTMMPFSLGQRAVDICEKLNIPYTAGFHVQPENVTSHFFVQDVTWINAQVYRYFYRTLYSHLSAIHYPSDFIKNKFESTIKKKTPAYVISNGVSKDFFPMKVERPKEFKNKILILFTARFAKEKTHPVLIKAVKYSKYKDRIQLIFAGKGPQEENLRKLAKREKLANMPIFKFFSHDQIVNIIRMCDLYVHPSNSEIEGISCLEAIAGGLVPIVSSSTRSATHNFALHKENIFEASNSKDLAKKIDYWLDNPRKMAKTKKEYRNFVKSLDREFCMNQMEKMFKETIEKYNGKNKRKKGRRI